MGQRHRNKWGCQKALQSPYYINERLSYKTTPPLAGEKPVMGHVCPNRLLRGIPWIARAVTALPLWMKHSQLPFPGTLWDQPNVMASALILCEAEANRADAMRMELKAGP